MSLEEKDKKIIEIAKEKWEKLKEFEQDYSYEKLAALW